MSAATLSDRTALVTGASRGIGQAIALALAGAGANTVLVARSRDPLEETARQIERLRGHSGVLVGDVADPATAESAVALALQRFGRLDILVNNAGMNVEARLLAELSVEAWRRMIEVNLNSMFYFFRAALPALRVGGGRIVNILSRAVREPGAQAGAAYIAAKLGALGLTREINVQERIHGIRACAIVPGWVNTPILDARRVPVAPEERAAMLQPADVASAVLYAVTSPGHVMVEEIVLRAQFLDKPTAAPG